MTEAKMDKIERAINAKQVGAEKIAEHLGQIPKIHRADYENAVSGKSRKAGVKSFCLECVGWQKEEIRLCTSLECPLYLYRPYQERPNHSDNRLGSAPESKNSDKGDNYAR